MIIIRNNTPIAKQKKVIERIYYQLQYLFYTACKNMGQDDREFMVNKKEASLMKRRKNIVFVAAKLQKVYMLYAYVM